MRALSWNCRRAVGGGSIVGGTKVTITTALADALHADEVGAKRESVTRSTRCQASLIARRGSVFITSLFLCIAKRLRRR